jgi:hypothetical protein
MAGGSRARLAQKACHSQARSTLSAGTDWLTSPEYKSSTPSVKRSASNPPSAKSGAAKSAMSSALRACSASRTKLRAAKAVRARRPAIKRAPSAMPRRNTHRTSAKA